MTDRCVQHPDLQCELRSVSFARHGRTVYLDLPDDNCTDMNGAIRLVNVRSPAVDRIHTLVGGAADTSYHLETDGQWKAY